MKSKNNPARLRREQSFLGIHFDFHAGDDCKQIGKSVTPAMVKRIVEQVRPDYIQCDCKGHTGFSSYPTKVGNRAPGFVKDQLRIWRNVTAKYGVALYVHYSGVFDSQALKHHPSWARIDENGKRDKGITSVFGPYVDRLLMPQLKELCDDYGVDGVWIDGDSRFTRLDYSPTVLKAFREETRIKSVPRKPEDPYYSEFAEFCREGFRRYLDRYVVALHGHNPDFQICSNWAFSARMPEPVGVDVDFLSGDTAMANSINAERFEARCLVHQGKPWDLMPWSFVFRWESEDPSTKSIPQMLQEAAIVLSLGGGFQAYFQQKRDGSISEWQMKLMAETAKFCRKRQKFCHRAKPVPQIALLHLGKAYYRENTRLFDALDGDLSSLIPIQGILQNLLDSQNVVDVLMEHHLSEQISDYSLVVIPEGNYLDKDVKKELLEYVKSGGKLLVVGPGAAAMFKRELGVRFVGKAQEKDNWLLHSGWMCSLKTVSQKIVLKDDVQQFGKLYLENDVVGPSSPAASIAKYGKGKIAGIYVNLGERYCHAATSTSRKFLKDIVRKLFPRPIVEVAGSQYVDVTANRIDNKLMINLINTAGPHADENVYVFDDIPPVGPLIVKIRTGKKPEKVTLQPANVALDYKYRNGEVRLTLSRLEIHDIIVVG